MKKNLPYILLLSLLLCLGTSCEHFSGSGQAALLTHINEWNTGPEKIRKQLQDDPEILRKKEVEEFYSSRDYSPAWVAAADRTALLEALQSADAEGLSYEDYHAQEILELAEMDSNLNGKQIARLDMLLTDAFLAYAHDLYYGRLDPKKLNTSWGVYRKDLDLAALLQKSLSSGNLADAFEGLKPTHSVYQDLQLALQEYKQLMESDQQITRIPEGETIKPGDMDSRIPLIAKRLKELELLGDVEVTDSTYSETIQAAIEEYQENKVLQVDGIIGNSTIAELNTTPEQRYKQILANLERWRWYPRDLGDHYILINIPQFKLAVVKNGDTVRRHNIIAGTRERQTPIFTDTLAYAVFNPQWTVPPTIKAKDVIPQASKDPSYVSRHNMKVVGPDGEVLDPSRIDWNSPDVRSYSFVQRAGPSNPLGKVKIIYPNRFLVYLHDTPAKNLFSQNQRAESSGCVRVENALELSQYVLQDREEWMEETIKDTISSGKTVQVKINQPIQVHHFYWTAWRAGDKTVFSEDVYNLDKDIYTRLLGED